MLLYQNARYLPSNVRKVIIIQLPVSSQRATASQTYWHNTKDVREILDLQGKKRRKKKFLFCTDPYLIKKKKKSQNQLYVNQQAKKLNAKRFFSFLIFNIHVTLQCTIILDKFTVHVQCTQLLLQISAMCIYRCFL